MLGKVPTPSSPPPHFHCYKGTYSLIWSLSSSEYCCRKHREPREGDSVKCALASINSWIIFFWWSFLWMIFELRVFTMLKLRWSERRSGQIRGCGTYWGAAILMAIIKENSGVWFWGEFPRKVQRHRTWSKKLEDIVGRISVGISYLADPTLGELEDHSG